MFLSVLLSDLPVEIIHISIYNFLLLEDFKTLDSAITNKILRNVYLQSLHHFVYKWNGDRKFSYSTLLWVTLKHFSMKQLILQSKSIDNKILAIIKSMKDLHVLNISKPINICGHCNKHSNTGLLACSQCKRVVYCNESCQKSAWKDHKKLCQPSPSDSKKFVEKLIEDNAAVEQGQERNLQVLNLQKCPVSDALVAKLTYKCPLLHTINLDDSAITDQTVLMLATTCRLLHTLSINNCKAITEKPIIKLAQLCPYLRNISVDGCKITNAAIVAIATHCPALRMISCKQCKITDKAIITVAKNCTEILSINCLFLSLH